MESGVSTLPFDLSLTELAVLTLTNDGIIERPEYYPFRPKEPIVLSCKTSYTWGSTIALILEKNPDISEARFIDAYRNALGKNQNEIARYYSEYKREVDDRILFERRYLYRLHEDFVRFFDRPPNFVFRGEESGEEAYRSLVRKGLIEDPIFTTIFGVSVAVVGFVPYSFTQRTRRGRTAYRRIEALFWSYEMRQDKGAKAVNIHFRLWKILRAFKRALAEEMEDIAESPKTGK